MNARASVDVDGALLADARRAAGLQTDAETAEEALRLLLRLHGRTEILGLAGKVSWTGDLGASRCGRQFEDRKAAPNG